MSGLPSSITARVQNVENCIVSIRTRLREADTLGDSDAVMAILIQVNIELQVIRNIVADIRSLVHYPV